MRNICFCADHAIRDRFEGLPPKALINATSALRPRKASNDTVTYTTLIVLRELGQRARNLREETNRLNALLRPLINDTAPELLAVYRVGIDTAAKLLIAAGDNPERRHSEAAWAHLCGVARSRRRRARPLGTGSTAAGTARRTRRSTPSC